MMRLDCKSNAGSSNCETEYSQYLMSKAKQSEGCVKVKRTQISFETYEVLLVKAGGGKGQIRCRTCNATVQGLKPEDAAAVIGSSVRAIYRWIESGTVHFTESSDGLLLICVNSLTNTNG